MLLRLDSKQGRRDTPPNCREETGKMTGNEFGNATTYVNIINQELSV